MVLLDSGVIATGDGAALGAAVLVLALAVTIVPFGFVVAWELVKGFVMGEVDDN